MTRQHVTIKTGMTQLRGIPALLSGHSFVFARATLLVLVVFSLGAFVASIPTYAAYLHILCTPAACHGMQLDGNTLRLSARMLRRLQEVGISLDFYITYIVLLHLLLAFGYLAMGTILCWRKSDHWMALLAAFCWVTFASFRDSTMLETLSPALQWPVTCASFLGEISFGLFFYLFPSGSFVPWWTRWLLVGAIVYFGAVNFFPFSPFNPFALNSTLNPVTFLILVSSLVIVQAYRYRRISNRSERQQTKWVVFGVSLALVGQIGLALLGIVYPAGEQNPLLLLPYQTLFTIFELLIPLSIGLAILYHRLWDIDLIINRTLVYGLLTASIVGIYVLVVVSLGMVLRADGNLLISLVATGLIAVLFQPLREWLQRGVNRLLYGQRDEPYTVIARLSQQLKGTLAPDAVLSIIAETVAQALKLPYTAILWKQGETFELAASYGRPAGEPLTLPLVYQAETIGQLQLAPRTPGEAFTSADMRLLDELARQAGLAAHAVRLATDLQKARERLVLAREEERRRLRRDLHDGVGPTLASLSQRIDTACHLISRDPAAAIALLSNLKTQVKTTIGDIRRVVYALRPPILDELGLVSAIREHMMHLQGVNGLHVSVEVPIDLPELSAAVEVATYRVALEALTNVERHAHAQHCLVRLELADERSLCLSISDDGRGLPSEYHAGVGITSMRERVAELGGECTITAKAAGGTCVCVRLPLKS